MSDPDWDALPTLPDAPLRPTARVLLVDPGPRLLLFRSVAASGEAFWYPVGGGVEPGESSEAAARREVAEETGLDHLDELVEVWRRRVVSRATGTKLDFRERWYLARVPAFEIDTAGFTPEERRTVLEHRWWPLDALATSTDRVVVPDLADRVTALLRHGPPSEPVLLPTPYHPPARERHRPTTSRPDGTRTAGQAAPAGRQSDEYR